MAGAAIETAGSLIGVRVPLLCSVPSPHLVVEEGTGWAYRHTQLRWRREILDPQPAPKVNNSY